jgi:hypothetical protein
MLKRITMGLTRISMEKFKNGEIQHAKEIKGGVAPLPSAVPNGGSACSTPGGRSIGKDGMKTWEEDAEIYNAKGQLIETDYDGQCP